MRLPFIKAIKAIGGGCKYPTPFPNKGWEYRSIILFPVPSKNINWPARMKCLIGGGKLFKNWFNPKNNFNQLYFLI